MRYFIRAKQDTISYPWVGMVKSIEVMSFGVGAILREEQINGDKSEWLLCDGSAVSRYLYPDLFAMLSTNFGAGDGKTTFNLPDLRDDAP